MVLLPEREQVRFRRKVCGAESPEIDPHALTQLGIDLLIDLAQRGEINPWDVQVIDVIDNHLSRIPQQIAAMAGDKQANLSLSGQAFLWAAMLVLLKANSLEEQQFPEVEEDFLADDPDHLALLQLRALPPNLEQRIRRRLTSSPMQRRPVTLQDLILQLRSIAAKMSDQPVRTRKARIVNLSATKAAQAIAELAHSENLTETAAQLAEFLQAIELDWIDLEDLLRLWVKAMENDQGEITTHDRVGVFWALLLLSSQSKVELSQEEFYQEIKVRTIFHESLPIIDLNANISLLSPILHDN
jgi:segregation and condensation protein A